MPKKYQTLPTPPERCPASRLGHSWRALNHTDEEVSQRCRFCKQQRALPTWHAQRPREKPTRQK